MRGRLNEPDGRREHLGVRGERRRIGGRVLQVHPLAWGAELRRPEGQWPNGPDGLAKNHRVARVPVRRALVPAPAAEGPSELRSPVPAGAGADARRVRMHAQARDLGLPRSEHLASVELGRQRRDHRQRRVLPRDPEVDRHELAGVRAGGGRVQLRAGAVSRRNRGDARPLPRKRKQRGYCSAGLRRGSDSWTGVSSDLEATVTWSPPAGRERTSSVASWARGDGVHDREAEAVTVAVRWCARAPRRWNGCWQALELLGWDHGAVVGHRQDRLPVAGRGATIDAPAGDVVADRVVEQVRDQPLQQLRVALDAGRVERRVSTAGPRRSISSRRSASTSSVDRRQVDAARGARGRARCWPG